MERQPSKSEDTDRSANLRNEGGKMTITDTKSHDTLGSASTRRREDAGFGPSGRVTPIFTEHSNTSDWKERRRDQIFGRNITRILAANGSNDWAEIVKLVTCAKRLLHIAKVGEEIENRGDHMLLCEIFRNHPVYGAKFSSEVAFFKVGYSRKAETTKCFWVVRSDGSEDDFSYHKCILNKAMQMKPPLSDLYKETYFSQYPKEFVDGLEASLQNLSVT